MNGLLGSRIFETAAGLSFVYVLLALFCSSAHEWIATLFELRALTLRRAIRALFSNQPCGERLILNSFYEHPLIAGLMQCGSHPTYLPPRAFSTAVLDLVTPETPGPIYFDDLQQGIVKLPAGDFRTALLALLSNTGGDLSHAQANIESWFNDSMDRASAHYKRRAQWLTLCLAIAVTLLLNADTLHILRCLWLAQPGDWLGWQQSPTGAASWISRGTGWLLTIAAVSLGAPFWFDLLNRFVRVRPSHDASGSRALRGLQDHRS